MVLIAALRLVLAGMEAVEGQSASGLVGTEVVEVLLGQVPAEIGVVGDHYDDDGHSSVFHA